MERIHRSYFGEEVEFTSWSDAYEDYHNRNWSEHEARDFVRQCKQIVEGPGDLPETYFKIIDPENIDLQTVEEELSDIAYDPDAEGSDREGFEYRIVDGEVDGRYIYTDVETQVSFSGGVNDYVSEGAIEFRIDPSQNLLILETTRVVEVQKAKSYFNRTNFNIVVCRNLTAMPDDAVDRVNSFIDSFAEEVEEEGPTLLSVDGVKLHNPPNMRDDEEDEEEVSLKNIDFNGSNVREHPEIRDHLDRNWIIKNIEAAVHYDDSLFTLKMAGTEVMGYSKIEDVNNYDKGNELINEVRSRYLEHIA